MFSILTPPIAFFLILSVSIILALLASRLAIKNKRSSDEYKKAYSCGEDFGGHLIQPDYRQFFPFAFFFTILHVVALMIATVPTETASSFWLALIYILCAITGLLILLRR